jgi:hypothetical protein
LGTEPGADEGGDGGGTDSEKGAVTISNIALECRVRRGPDWDERRNKGQDGGPGGHGTVVAFRRAGTGAADLALPHPHTVSRASACPTCA